MATAKQIAARKEFSRIMKSGGFPKAKKRAAAKPRKKNPLARSGNNARASAQFDADKNERQENPIARGGRNTRPLMSERVQGGRNSSRRDLSKAPAARRKNPLARGGKNTRPLMSEQQSHGWPDRTAQDLRGRKTNPLHAVGRYQVFEARGGIAGKLLATFPSKTDATAYARAWADAKNCPAVIHGRRA